MPIVPCPAMTSGSSNGWMKVRCRSFSSFLAWSQVSENESPYSTTSTLSPPCARTAFILTGGVVVGMAMMARQSSRLAASATPWAWLPAEAQITPFFSWSAERFAILLYAPRSLKLNTLCMSSRLSRIWLPVRLERLAACSSGDSMATS